MQSLLRRVNGQVERDCASIGNAAGAGMCVGQLANGKHPRLVPSANEKRSLEGSRLRSVESNWLCVKSLVEDLLEIADNCVNV